MLLLGSMLGQAGRGVADRSADLILVNGRVYTVDAARPWAEAVAVRAGRIVAVGNSTEIRTLAGADTRVIDLAGAFVSPGFNDAHVHVESTGALLTGANLLEVHEPKAFRERLADAAKRLPAGSWITRGDWGAYEKWAQGSAGTTGTTGTTGTGPFMPDRRLIDDVTPNHPVLVNRFDQSVFLANSLALKLAGVTEATENPQGGEFVRDATGRLTGLVRGSAVAVVRKAVTPVSFEQRLTQVRAVLREAREGGVTTIQDLTSADQLRAYQEIAQRGELTVRIMLRPTLDNAQRIADLGITRGFGNDWLKYIGFKAWVDGIMGASTAMFFEPYSNNAANKGTLRPIMSPEGKEGFAAAMTVSQHYTEAPPGNLEKLLKVAARTGLTPHVHAIGDKANRMLLDIFERVLTEEGSPARTIAGASFTRRSCIHPTSRASASSGWSPSEPVPRVGRHALDGGTHRRRTIAGPTLPDAQEHRRGARLRQRQSRDQCRPLLPESRLRVVRCGLAANARRRAEGRMVPERAPDDRGSHRGRHEECRLGVVRRSEQRDPHAGQAGGHRRVRHEPRGRRLEGSGPTPQGPGPLHHRRWQGRPRGPLTHIISSDEISLVARDGESSLGA